MTKLFTTEAELCAAFIAALPKGWTAYPEWGGFDILLSGSQRRPGSGERGRRAAALTPKQHPQKGR